MKKKIISAIFICLALTIIATPIKMYKVFALDERASVVLDAKGKNVLYGYNEHDRLPMASTTKITTAIVAIENYPDLDRMVKVDDSAVGIEGTSIYLEYGEEISMRELLLGLMLASGNDCACAIACEVAGSQDGFVQMMNDFVANLGLSDTHYDNPHGLDSPTHYTSAYDLAYITSYALDNPTFREICSTKTATISGNSKNEARYLRHKNKLLFSDPNCIGVKTGFTDNAGRCLVHATEADNMRLVSVVLNCGPMFDRCKELDENIRSEYSYHQFIAPYSVVGRVVVSNGDVEYINAAVKNGYDCVIKSSDIDKYTTVFDMTYDMEAPIEKDQVIGSAKVLFGDEEIFSTPIYAISGAENIDIRYYLDNIIDEWI